MAARGISTSRATVHPLPIKSKFLGDGEAVPTPATQAASGDASEPRKIPPALSTRNRGSITGSAHIAIGASRRNLTQVKSLEPGSSSMLLAVKEKLPTSRAAIAVTQVLDGKPATAVMLLFTVYALFGDDLRQTFAAPSADNVFYGMSCATMALYMVELVANSLYRPAYFLRFYFWLDLVSTARCVSGGWGARGCTTLLYTVPSPHVAPLYTIVVCSSGDALAGCSSDGTRLHAPLAWRMAVVVCCPWSRLQRSPCSSLTLPFPVPPRLLTPSPSPA